MSTFCQIYKRYTYILSLNSGASPKSTYSLAPSLPCIPGPHSHIFWAGFYIFNYFLVLDMHFYFLFAYICIPTYHLVSLLTPPSLSSRSGRPAQTATRTTSRLGPGTKPKNRSVDDGYPFSSKIIKMKTYHAKKSPNIRTVLLSFANQDIIYYAF